MIKRLTIALLKLYKVILKSLWQGSIFELQKFILKVF